jgi:hypothetical protein
MQNIILQVGVTILLNSPTSFWPSLSGDGEGEGVEPYRLILLGDSCSGVPHHLHEQNFRALREALLRRRPHSRTLCYLGDHVSGYVADERELRLQWRHFIDREFSDFVSAFNRIFHIPGNHDVYSAASLSLYDQVLPQRHANVVARKGLNYAVRDGSALLVFLNTANPANHGHAMLDVAWLEQALAKGRDATIKLVFGHHPILPVNGYDLHPDWRIAPEDGDRAWAMMRVAGVKAYICSHIIAFDFRVRDGLAQLCTGGAGTEYGPGGAMPGDVEYRHFVEFDASATHIGYRVIDELGRCRERCTWPPSLLQPVEADVPLVPGSPISVRALSVAAPDAAFRLAWSFRFARPLESPSALIVGRSHEGATPSFLIDFRADGEPLAVHVTPHPNRKEHSWVVPHTPYRQPLVVEVAALSGAGPGGIMARLEGGDWTSMTSASACGIEGIEWPAHWEVPLSSNRMPPSSYSIEMSVRPLGRLERW